MRKITFLIIVLTGTYVFSKENYTTLANEVKVVEFLDEILDMVNYNDYDFQEPTKLIYKNLIATEMVFVTNTKNLVAIEFPKLNHVKGDFYIGNNSDLNQLNSPLLEFVDEELSFHQNPKLEKINFHQLKRTGHHLYFHQNNDLTSVNAPMLEEIVGPLYFHQNLNLKVIHLPELLIINDYLYVNGNRSLETLNICNLKRIIQTSDQEPYIYLADNTDTIDQSPFCFYLDSPENLQNQDDELPHNNEDESEEVKDNDGDNLGEEEDSEDDPTIEDEPTRVSLYPNPTKGVFRIDSEIEFYKIEIYEATGNLVATFRSPQEEYDISLLPSGLYYVLAYHPDGVHATVKKLMLQ
ncbi:T9SS type A sorting domain-containing protein [Flagellimonas myxillae]|uniref:T9SS type A sorting domain-containing protein n=1 Tax=Flagellimonas myxillae TaxID=2942214 RepID=UPI00201F2F7C|nr:T9SS type A sorting domain-containing protein [Muricauda myxillae]MCL6266094.1 T9SS type A sorting domain-containing protein [Muricauda myxillae]